jgi:teichuronic acid biosynthesis glycosyltransferase TuaC
MSADRLNVLTFTTLYPNAEQPTHGIFVENRMRQLVKRHPQVKVTVVAPVPWFPFKSRRFGRYGAQARVPREEQRHGIRVLHPRYLLIPKVGMSLAPLLMFLSLFLFVRRLVRNAAAPYQVLDAHYFYPDGVAAVMLGKLLRLPVVVTARGTDINLIPRWRLPRWQLRWAIRRADAVIAVCQALKEAIQGLAEDVCEVEVLRNGVDLQMFSPPTDRARLRAELGFDRVTLVCAGHLIERKGPHLVVEALHRLDDVELVFVGEGELRDALTTQVRSLELESRVRFLGALDQGELKKYYQAADFLVLASSREGWANVLLEAMACGTPVIGTRVWGTPEAVDEGVSGLLVDSRTPQAIAEAIDAARRKHFDRHAVRRWAERFSWDETSDGLLALLAQAGQGVNSEAAAR